MLLVRLIIRDEVKAVGRPISFGMSPGVCVLRDQGAWRLVHEHMSVLFHADGGEMVGPRMNHQELRAVR